MPFRPRKTFRAHAAAALAAVMLAACGGGHNDDLPLAFSATLSGAEQLPSNASAASGIGLVTIDRERRTLTASIVVNGIADTAAHIRQGQPRLAGPVVFPLAKAPGTAVWSTRAAITHEQLHALQDGMYYMEVQSVNFPNGELRGQLAWSLPPTDQLARLEQVRAQSVLLSQQLDDVRDIEDAWDWNGVWGGHWGGHWTGIGWGFAIGF